MRYEEFVERVRQRAGLDSFEEAERATRATIGRLGEYLNDKKGLEVASQLPQELSEHLRWQSPKRGGIQTPTDFLERVGQSEGVSLEEAEAHTKAVMGVLWEAVGQNEMENVRRQFPGEFAPLFINAE